MGRRPWSGWRVDPAKSSCPSSPRRSEPTGQSTRMTSSSSPPVPYSPRDRGAPAPQEPPTKSVTGVPRDMASRTKAHGASRIVRRRGEGVVSVLAQIGVDLEPLTEEASEGCDGALVSGKPSGCCERRSRAVSALVAEPSPSSVVHPRGRTKSSQRPAWPRHFLLRSKPKSERGSLGCRGPQPAWNA